MGRTEAPEVWREEGACFGQNDLVDAFYPPGEPWGMSDHIAPAVAAAEAEALAYCARCPVIVECLDFALATRQEWGTWGGLTARERRKVLRQRGIQTRKNKSVKRRAS